MHSQNNDRVLTALDYIRVAKLLERDAGERSGKAAKVAALLDDANVVSPQAVEPSIVTMYSHVLLRGIDDGVERTLALCYPKDAEPSFGFISVLSPLGLSLLGQKVGALVHWEGPDGLERAAELVDILFQPEASGDYVT